MKPYFDSTEALEMLGLAYAADLLGPHKQDDKSGFKPIKPQNDPTNPLPNDNGTTYPYPAKHIWPDGWTPAFPIKGFKIFFENVWDRSILEADPDNLPPFIINRKLGANNVVVTYSQLVDAYCVAFAGTENVLGFYRI